MNIYLNKAKSIALLTGLLFSGMSCETETPDPISGGEEPIEESRELSIALAVGSGSVSTTYVQSMADLSEGNISFDGFGFEVPSSRTARIFTSNDGKSLYDLDYGGGRVYKFTVNGGQDYSQVSETNVEYAIGTTNPRWTKIDDDYAMLHNVTTERIYDEATGNFIKTQPTARVMSINLDNLEIGKIEEFEIPVSAEDEANGDYVFRIDAPIVSGNKVYYGMGKSGYDAATDARKSAVYNGVETLVLDYPSLTNPTVIKSGIAEAKGATNGYRTPVCHLDENGDIYQLITVADNSADTYILKISNGQYDDSFSFNLSELLGENTKSNGWFYVGNGIGYVPYANTDLGDTGDPVWAVARIDIRNNTAIKLNLPDKLWLQQYQNSVVKDGKFYMALAPLGETGNVYIFDPSSTSADGFTKGASLQTGADAYYIGIY